MIFGRLRRARDAICAFGLVAAGLFAGPASAQTLDLAQLLTALAGVASSTATFEETRTVAALTTPIVRRGTLRYVRPDRLEMIVASPAPERIEINGEQLTLESGSGTKRVRLSEFPAAAAWVESVRATLAGDHPALGRYFHVRATGRMAAWTLELTPLDNELAGFVSRITIVGREARLTRIEIDERGGDRSVMAIAATDRRR
jgi:outer membrane lipoprotein-sorting protein